jgi:threonine dehydrogenase-like Zn-dependent dehydrogenase
MVSRRVDIQDAPDAYEKFDKRIDSYIKVLIRF